MKHCSTLFLTLLLTSSHCLFGQPPSVNPDFVSTLFSDFIQNSEKSILLQTDRNIYIAGEKIWFKAYTANSGDKSLSNYRNLFVDLVNDKDSVIDQLVLNNTQQRTNGVLDLPDSIASGFYWIRCYTAKQLAGDSANIFIEPVFILNKKLHDQSAYATQYERMYRNKNIKPDIHFFAERLTAIPGVISTGVIEIKDNYNNPLSVKGNLINSKDSVISVFTTNKLGLSRLTFINDPSEKYNVVFHLSGTDIKYPLPAAGQHDAQLSVARQTSKTIKAFVTLEESLPADMHTTILAVKGDSLCYAAVGTGSYGITIPLENFPHGIARLLLFDENKQLLSERKIYVPKEDVQIEIKPGKKKYDARENAAIHIKLTDPNSNPVAASLNVAVQDEWISQFADSIEVDAPPPSNELLLDKWVQLNNSKYSADDIDLLMATLTSNKQVNYTNTTTVIDKYDDNTKLLSLIGKVIDKKGNSINDRVVTLLTRNVQGFFMDVDTTGKDGMFDLPIPQGNDSLRLSLQVTDKHKAQRLEDSIVVDSFDFPVFPTPLSVKQQYMAENINTVSSLRKYHIDTAITFQGKGWLAPVTVTTVKKEEPNYDVSKRISSMSQILTGDKLSRSYGSVGLALLTVPGVSYAYGDITIFGLGISKPLILMDGAEFPLPNDAIPGPDGPVMTFLNSLSPSDIDFIEVLRGGEAAFYGVRGADGVISINTKHGTGRIDYSKTNFRSFIPITYHTATKFPMPDYSNKEVKSSTIPDPRTTIYWNGDLSTNQNGEADVNFFTADNATNYTVTVTGVTAKGDLIYKRITISNSGKIK
ncbi:hypothetical protein FRZ67_18330 [Panacibacter ginsenosidivorans]|uniref:TonB-dependent receptor plug domain-containing protein n=1 Tax=Panacibacter ginsenosidivorans TaxID=1813871 RepID=A0A5B8VCX7_9BACT|nr:TonB-dependent receptor plug domain-containing protein [Panacibacter ginsenosidivorans]QEC69172.1 hypothetical protein FRZ67_18330 [Panacibacter ginsenosidivorans]